MNRKLLLFILKLVVLIIVGSVIVGCRGSSNSQNPSGSTAQPTPPLTQSQRAEVAAVTKWLGVLDKTQSEILNGLQETLTVKTTSLGKVNGHSMTAEDLVRGLVFADANLIDVTFTWHNNDQYNRVHDLAGEAEVKGIEITLSSTHTLSEADVANGITFKGTFTIKFISHYRTRTSASYTSWGNDGEVYDVTMQNGTSTVQQESIQIGFNLDGVCGINNGCLFEAPMAAISAAIECEGYDGCPINGPPGTSYPYPDGYPS